MGNEDTASFHIKRTGFGGFDPNPLLVDMVWISSKYKELLRKSAPDVSVVEIISREIGCRMKQTK
eukprot:6724611-Heterocapsa_arctica.AAC.1